MHEPMLKKAMTTLELLSQDAAARAAYESRMKYLRDEASRMKGAREEGREEGLEAGIKKSKQEMAQKLLSLGHDVEFIANLTDLSEQEILALIQ